LDQFKVDKLKFKRGLITVIIIIIAVFFFAVVEEVNDEAFDPSNSEILMQTCYSFVRGIVFE